MQAVHFGAGNIGRGFIGLLLSQAGYEVCFVTRNKRKISLLQQRHKYRVRIADGTAESIMVDHVTATSIDNINAVVEAIASADLVTTAVGAAVLAQIAGVIAKGIEERIRRKPRPLTIIACENAVGGSTELKKWVYTHLDPSLHQRANRYIAFPNTVVDRIVPSVHQDDLLEVTVEPFYEWVVERSTMVEPVPDIKGVQYVDSLLPYVERKLFTVNTGHSSAAYLGYLKGYTTIQQAMKDPEIRRMVYIVLYETGQLLTQKYHFDAIQHHHYIEKIIHRFRNPNLTDDIVRVARNPIRKLGKFERLVRPMLQAYERGLQTTHLTTVVAAALLYSHNDDVQAVKLQKQIKTFGIEHIITRSTGITQGHPLHEAILHEYKNLSAVVPVRQ